MLLVLNPLGTIQAAEVLKLGPLANEELFDPPAEQLVDTFHS